jgi:hypothetical protein
MTDESCTATLEPPKRFVTTTAYSEPPAKVGGNGEQELRAAWQELIDQTLSKWQRDPSRLDEEGMTNPSAETIQCAIDLASTLDIRGMPAPTRISADVRGGIAFEFEQGQLFQSIHVRPDGRLEQRRFLKNRLVWRE